MQIPSVERSAHLPPVGAEVLVSAPTKVVPIAPVNPPTSPVQPVASVVNDINPAVQAKAAQDTASAPDPLRSGSQHDNSQRNWTERTPTPERADPPKEPLSKMLMDHIKAVWGASARTVEIWFRDNPTLDPSRPQNLAQNRNQDPSAVPGVLARESLTYSPSQIKKNESAERSARSRPQS